MAFFNNDWSGVRKRPYVDPGGLLGSRGLPLAAAGAAAEPYPATPAPIALSNLGNVSPGYGDPSGIFGGAPQAPSGGVGGGSAFGGYDPSQLQDMIENDPLYEQYKAQSAAERVADLASRTAARQRAVTLFGDVPDFSGTAGAQFGEGFSKDINDTIRGLAQENTAAGLSTVARINQAHQDAIEGIRNALASRGILSSGETGYQLGREDLATTKTRYDATQQLLDYLNGVQSGFVQSERARSMGLANAASAAASRLMYRPPAPSPPPQPGQPPQQQGTSDLMTYLNSLPNGAGIGWLYL